MPDQVLINLLIALVAALGGWIMRILWSAVKDLQSENRELIDRVASVEKLVAGEYVKREDFDRFVERINNKLDQVLEKLGKKADK